MLRLADAAPGFRILDPFCGSGTILLEAADIFNKEIAGVGSDSVSKTVEGAQKNAEMEGYGGCLRYVHCSAVALTREFVGQRFDAIITNPPWGVRDPPLPPSLHTYMTGVGALHPSTRSHFMLTCAILMNHRHS